MTDADLARAENVAALHAFWRRVRTIERVTKALTIVRSKRARAVLQAVRRRRTKRHD